MFKFSSILSLFVLFSGLLQAFNGDPYMADARVEWSRIDTLDNAYVRIEYKYF